MGRAQVAAQAQVQLQTSISHTESLELVRCLLRVSIFHVSYLRGLFPEKSFKGVDMKNLDDMHIKMLLPSCDESRRLIDWVEGGVYDAIKRGYLKNLFFGISTDPDGTELLEEYVFTFRYGDSGRVAMDVNAIMAEDGGEGGGKRRGKKGEFKQESGKADLNTVRYQVCRLIRMLVQVCRTLDKVPAERYLFMKLTYQDHTPDEYEPPYFIPVDESGIGHFKRAPFSMTVGRVATNHHTVNLKVKSTLDSCDDELMDGDGAGATAGVAHRSGGGGSSGGNHNGPTVTDRVTAQAQPSEGSNGSRDDGTDDAMMADQEEKSFDVIGNVMEDNGGDGGSLNVEPTVAPLPSANLDPEISPDEPAAAAVHEQLQLQPPPLVPSPADLGDPAVTTCANLDNMDVEPDADIGDRVGGGTEEDVTEAPEDEDYVAVCEYIRGRSQVNLTQLGRQFEAMSQSALGGYVGQLKEQGVLVAVPGARNRYRIVSPQASTMLAKKREVQSVPPKGDKGTCAESTAGGDADILGTAVDGGDMPKQTLGKRRPQQREAEDGAAAITMRMDGLSMEATRGNDAHVAGTDGSDPADDKVMIGELHRSRDKTNLADGSRRGRLESAQAGDELTGNADMADVDAENGPNVDAVRLQPSPALDEPHVYIVDSQHSGPERARASRVRKASYVADPIQQGGPASKKAKGPNTAAMALNPAACTLAHHSGGGAPTADKTDKTNVPTPRGTRGGSRLSGMRR